MIGDKPTTRPREVNLSPGFCNGNKDLNSLVKQETINLTPNCWIKTKGNLVIITTRDTVKTCHKDYFKFIPSNQTQRDFLNSLKPRAKPKKTSVKTSGIDMELNQLLTVDRLKKALLKHFNSIDRLRCLSGDDALLKRRRITKYKTTIKRYINQLRQDANFKLETIEKRIRLCYSGKYVTALKVVCL